MNEKSSSSVELFSNEAESYVLSGMLSDEMMLCVGVESLLITDFMGYENKTIYCALKTFYTENTKPSMEKLIMKLRDLGELDNIGGIASLTQRVCCYISTIEDFNYYVKIVRSKSILREVKNIAGIINSTIETTPTLSGFEFLPKCKALFDKITDYQNIQQEKPFKEECLNVLIPYMIDKRDGKVVEKVLSTGFKSLDDIVTGLGSGQLWTICARTGVGKTNFALNMALSLAKSGSNVYMFSMEMAYKEIADRLFSQMTGLRHDLIQSANLSDDNFSRISDAVLSLSEGSLVINDKGGLKINEICSIARRAKEHYGLSAIFIDYIQLIDGATNTEFRHLEIAQVTRSLKKLAKDLGIPVVALAQLSRKVEERQSQQIFLSDLKESGSIEEDSDVVIAINRRDMKDPYDHPGEATLSVLKNRHGRTGESRLIFNKEACIFNEMQRF